MDASKLKIQKYAPLIISGCSGVGKGTLITNLLDYFPELFELSVSYTTRKPRATQTHGKQHFFVSKPEFEKLIKENGFLQHCLVHGEHYGTNEAYVKNIINKGKICLLDVDIQGAEKIQAKYPNWNFIFIKPPSLEELKQRLVDRGMNSESDMKRRLTNAEKELKRLSEVKFYKQIVNDKMQACYDEFIHHINSLYHLLIEIQK